MKRFFLGVLPLLSFLVFSPQEPVGTVAAQDDVGLAEFSLTVNVSLVSVDFAVFDPAGRPVNTLVRDDFVVYEDGQPQEIRDFLSADTPLYVLILVDKSGSMERTWGFVLEAINSLVGTLRPQDYIGIAAFTCETEWIVPWRPARERYVATIDPDRPCTDVYQALDWAHLSAQRVGADRRKAVITITDGAAANFSGRRLREALARTAIPFYFIGLTSNKFTTQLSVRDRENVQRQMQELAEVSGGGAYFPDSAQELAPLHATLGRSMTAVYKMSYISTAAVRDGAFRSIEVRPVDLGLRVLQSRNGYLAN